MSKNIIITGSNGQLGQYLIKYLQENEPDVQIIGTLRHKTARNERYIFDTSKVIFELMDLSDSHSIHNLIIKYKPTYFCNTGANAFVAESWDLPEQHLQINALGVLHQLEAIRKHSSHTRYLNMGSSEEFADAQYTPQDEKHPICPKSPYSVSKACSRFLVKVYRESYKLYAIQPFCFNFESELRDPKYLPRKVSLGVAKICHALKNKLEIEPLEVGNLDSIRSWQWTGDVADAIWRLLNQDIFNKNYNGKPKEYVVSASDRYKVRDFIEVAFKAAGIDGFWQGNGDEECYYLANYLNEIIPFIQPKLVKINPKFYRLNDVHLLFGDSSLIRKELLWSPKVSFPELVKKMVFWDIDHYKI